MMDKTVNYKLMYDDGNVSLRLPDFQIRIPQKKKEKQ